MKSKGKFISRPPLVTTAVGLFVIAFLGFAATTPIATSDQPDWVSAPVQYWWARIAPRSYALRSLAEAEWFGLPTADRDCMHTEDNTRAWHTVAADPKADSLFLGLYAAGKPATRLYALVGLNHIKSLSLDTLLIKTQMDTASVLFVRTRPFRTIRVSLSELAAADAIATWADSLSKVSACAT